MNTSQAITAPASLTTRAVTQHCPHLAEQDGFPVPSAPNSLPDADVDKGLLTDLILKHAHTVPSCTTRWISEQIRLPLPIIERLLMELAQDHYLEVLGFESASNHRYRVTERGHDRALRLLSVSRYLGPAPVSIDQYSMMMQIQRARFPAITLPAVRQSLGELVLDEEDVKIAAMAAASERSLFLWGPPGNGKTSVARSLHAALSGELWIPYCLNVGSDIIQVFDSHVHHESNREFPRPWDIDQRWVLIERPLVVGGGEMTIETLELTRSESQGFYEAPLHVKANGGIFVIDDFGRQRVDPWQLLNRWIIPMEHGFDYLALANGRKITLPFLQMLIVATNIDPNKVMDPAFLRRMGYRIHIKPPTEAQYRTIFGRCAAHYHLKVEDQLVTDLIDRYRSEHRPMRSCEPRDLLNRVHDACLLEDQPMHITGELLDLAWRGYFGSVQVNSSEEEQPGAHPASSPDDTDTAGEGS